MPGERHGLTVTSIFRQSEKAAGMNLEVSQMAGLSSESKGNGRI